MRKHDVEPSQDDEVINISAWKMWRTVLKTCGPWTAFVTGIRYLWMMAKGEI